MIYATVTNKGNLTDFKNEYMKCRKLLDKEEKNWILRLTFKSEVDLHIDKYVRNDKTDKVHTVKKLFFTNNGIANCMWEDKLEATNAYYTPLRNRTSGYYLPFNELLTCEFIKNEMTKSDYTKEWENIANSMEKYNINPETVKAIRNHLQGKAEHIEGFQNYWKKTQKPKTMSFADVTRGITIAEMKKQAVKTEYSDNKYLFYNMKKYGQRRDKSVSIQVYKDNSIRLYSASEYAGTGNGDYYLMYSPTMAFYTESD